MQRQNFGGNISLTPKTAFAPATEQEVLEIMDRHHGRRIRCVGRLHSWSRAVESEDVLLDLRLLNQIQPISDGDRPLVSVGAGCQLKRLLSELERLKQWTLPSLGLITEQTVAGAVSTGTHGSGRNSLSHYVVSVRIAHYDSNTGRATITEISDGDALRAARCSLGCLGVILSVKMLCRPSYNVEEAFHEHEQLAEVLMAEEQYPLQQFFLVPWRWTYMSQYRRETDRRRSGTASLYHWYRYLTIDLAMLMLMPPHAEIYPVFVILFFGFFALRIWVIASLGPYWTTRILTLDAPLVVKGPYRVVRHPNYLAVAGEIATLPLAFGQWRIALVFSLLNAALLYWRIRIEDQALSARRR